MSSVVPIDVALARGDVAGAVKLARDALAKGDRDAFVVNLVAWRMANDGDPVAAEALIREGLSTSPDDPGLLTTLGLALRRQLRFSEAMRAFDAAIALAPAYPAVWIERGFALRQSNFLRLAEASFMRAAALDPASAVAFAGIAAIASVQGDVAKAREYADRALALDPNDPVAQLAIARCDTATGNADAAAARLVPLLTSATLSAENRSIAHTLLGDALARLDRRAAAFAAYESAKADLRVRFPALADAPRLRDVAERMAAAAAFDDGPWQAEIPENPRGLGFLLGFPRSGTTLVDTVLAGIPGVVTLEEMPTFAAADAAFLLPSDGPARLARNDPAQNATLRADYWHRVTGLGVGEAPLFIDMDPMNTLRLQVIGRLFGTAPVVVMRRDPRDVVLSCFRQNFAASALALEFTTLTDAAAFYAAMMRLQRECLARLPNPVFELRYEELVADFDGVTQRLCDFLGLPWSTQLRDFAETARQRDIGTASVGQVRRALFDGSGQWRKFAAEMAPVAPILAEWVAAFGYDDA